MNERIDKLIEECTSVYDDLVYDGTDSYMKTTEYFDKEKFALLIVRECAKYVDVMWPDQKEFKGTLDVGKGLKAKFGVE